MNLFELVGNVTINDGSAISSMNNIHSMADNLGSKLSNVGQGMQNIGATLTGAVTMPIAGLTAFGIKYNSTMEDLQTSFKVMLGSQEKAVDMTEKLVKMGASTPFESSQLAEYTKTMLSFGYTGENVLPIMSRLGDVSLGNNEKMSSLTRTMGQINSLGKLQGGDLNQLIGQGWNPLNAIIAKSGETMAQVRDRMSQGKVSYQEVEQALISVTSEGGTFYNGMAEGSKTFSGQLSTLKDTFQMFIGQVTKPIFDKLLEMLPKVIEKLSGLGNMFSKLPDKSKMMILAIAGIAAAIGPVILIAGTFISAIGAIIPVIGAISLTMVGWVAGIAAIGAVITGAIVVLVKYGNSFKEMKDKIFTAITTMKNTIVAIFTDIYNFIAPYWEKLKNACMPAFNKMVDEGQKLIGTLALAITNKLNEIKAIWDFVFPYLKIVAEKIFPYLQTYITHVLTAITNVFTIIRQVISGDWSGLWETVKNIISGAGGHLINIVSNIQGRINAIWSDLVHHISRAIWNLGSDMYNSGSNLMSMLYNGIMSQVQKVKNAASNVASSISSFLGFSSPTKEGAGKNSDLWMPNLINMMTKGLEDGKGKIKQAVSNVSDNLIMSGNIKYNNLSGLSGTTSKQGQQLILQINNPHIFNQRDIDQLMNPVISTLRRRGLIL